MGAPTLLWPIIIQDSHLLTAFYCLVSAAAFRSISFRLSSEIISPHGLYAIRSFPAVPSLPGGTAGSR